MTELKCRISRASRDFKSRLFNIEFEFADEKNAERMYNEFTGTDIVVSVKRYKKKRSLDANAYAWVLLDKLSAKLGLPKEELYKDFIKSVGENNDVVCVTDKAKDSLIKGWEHNGLGWVTDTFPSKIEGCTNVILYYGSSTYDTSQMSRLTNLIVDECKGQGIDTDTPDEIANRLSLWEGK